ncbi:MAG: class I SAM-dependent methyltransferase [Azoarcus sp.]|jgi:SAM-dependent methyltransferase|nr:class I SAM-dependent methyltransferase [Azoarcus sp.]
MKIKSDNYLADYRESCDVDLSRGLSGYIRNRLDNMAVRKNQPDRHALFLPRVCNLFGLSLEKQLTVMEIGCGNGWAISYQSPKVKYIAIDRGSVFRTDLESRGIEFHEADVETTPLPIANQSVDLILLNHVIEHIANTDYLVGELRRALRSNGYLYIRTPNLAKVGWSFWDDYTHVKPFTESSLDHLMRTHNFKKAFSFHSDHTRIMIDLLFQSCFRTFVFGKFGGGKEIEAGYSLLDN